MKMSFLFVFICLFCRWQSLFFYALVFSARPAMSPTFVPHEKCLHLWNLCVIKWNPTHGNYSLYIVIGVWFVKTNGTESVNRMVLWQKKMPDLIQTDMKSLTYSRDWIVLTNKTTTNAIWVRREQINFNFPIKISKNLVCHEHNPLKMRTDMLSPCFCCRGSSTATLGPWHVFAFHCEPEKKKNPAFPWQPLELKMYHHFPIQKVKEAMVASDVMPSLGAWQIILSKQLLVTYNAILTITHTYYPHLTPFVHWTMEQHLA